MKKVWDIISGIFVWTVVLIAVVMMVFTIVSVNTFNRGDRDLFGYKAFIVLSDSMSATDFDAGDLAVVREVDPSSLQPGDIITYTSQNEHNYGQNVTHKIRARTTTPDGNPGFITYGTTTNIDDAAVVTYPYIQGQYVFALPKVGTFFNFLKTPVGYILFILVPFLVLIAWQGINCVKAFRGYKKEQMAELEAEKEAIAAERKKNELMMQQLLQMQQQMQQMQQAPIQQSPVQQVPVQQIPVQQPPVQEAPIQQEPVQQAPVQQPVRQAPVQQPTLEWDFSLPKSAPQAQPGLHQPKPQTSAAQPRRVQEQTVPSPRPQPKPVSRTNPEPQAPQLHSLPLTDDSDVDDIIAELSALCGRPTDKR